MREGFVVTGPKIGSPSVKDEVSGATSLVRKKRHLPSIPCSYSSADSILESTSLAYDKSMGGLLGGLLDTV